MLKKRTMSHVHATHIRHANLANVELFNCNIFAYGKQIFNLAHYTLLSFC